MFAKPLLPHICCILLLLLFYPAILFCQDIYKVQVQTTNIRAQGNKEAAILGRLKMGDTIKATLRKGDWIGFRFDNNKTGYISIKNLALIPREDSMHLKEKDTLSYKWEKAQKDLTYINLAPATFKYFMLAMLVVAAGVFIKHYLL